MACFLPSGPAGMLARADSWRPAGRRGAADLGSVLGFVLEGELELGAIGDRPVLVQVNVLLDDLGYPQIAERPGGCPDRLCRRVFPRSAACPDDLGHPVHAHDALL